MDVSQAIQTIRQHLETHEIELDGESWDFTFCVRRVEAKGDGVRVVFALEDDCYDENDPDSISELTVRLLDKAIADVRGAHPELADLSIELGHFKN